MTKKSYDKPLPLILQSAQNRPSRWAALRFKRSGKWIDWSWSDYAKAVENCARALIDRGVHPQDKVAVFAGTRPEWACADLAVMSVRAITVPIYFNSTADEVAHILNDSGAGVLFLEGSSQFKKWESVRKQCPNVNHVIVMESRGELTANDGILWDQFTNNPALQNEELTKTFQERLGEISFEDIATIVYTSGTSGLPKGVVLGHQQILSELSDINAVFRISNSDVALSFLPYAHVLGRIEMWLNIYAGFTLAFAEGIEKIKDNLVEVRPTLMIAVPRIFEKLYATIMTRLEAHALAKTALNATESLPLGPLRTPLLKWLLKEVRAALGGRLRFAISGGAPLSADIAHFFKKAGIDLFEGYGLTETTAAICVNTEADHRAGTVGKPLPDVQIRLAEDGEILVKSDKVLREYYQNPEETKNAFQDGFFKTGDIGEFDENGYLKITDRKKDLIKTSGGKYVAPQRIENALKQSPVISQVLVHGDRRKYIVALITLSEPELKAWARRKSLSFSDYASLTQSSQTKQMVGELIKTANNKLASHESVKKFAILPKDFSVEQCELTPSLKLRRKYCDQKYADVLDSLYA